jgi:predicted DNA-binding protein
MAVQARFTTPTQVVETPEMKARIEAIADREGISYAQVVRDIVRYGIEWREDSAQATPAALYALRIKA